MKASRSALIVSACVVGMPVWKSGVGLHRPVLNELRGQRAGVGVGDDLVVITVHHQHGHA